MSRVIDPRLRGAIPEHWESLCTIQDAVSVENAVHEFIPTGAYTDVQGMVNIPCRIGPLITVRPTSAEVPQDTVTGQVVRRQLKLNGYFPGITVLQQAVVDGVAYPINGVESDGSKFSTRLYLEVVEPNG